eukprot:CAMPEP_0197056546 /NCGR_PEP_ID=MMETSP1384-20130603/86839_1 /TAXON_ID=29189 /ORGANISM="Ammonia sp." /LENGTH=379 /DNA_ID=CAMNT_0042490605 /DNA_START=26 /DNA_END=1165 /DNA_ORIENTATION=-
MATATCTKRIGKAMHGSASLHLNRAAIYTHRSRFNSSSSEVAVPESKEIIYVNPTNALDGYEIVNSRFKPSIPALGFGTWGCDHFSAEHIAQSVDTALKIGYRHIDCARVYANEKEIGAVLSDHLSSGAVRREDLFITSKLFNNEHAPPDGAPLRALETTLKDLNLDYVDAFLIHWPFRNSKHTPPLPFNLETWFFTYKLLHELNLQGLTRSVGICNATVTKMKGLVKLCHRYKISKPGLAQFELHPYLQQDSVLQFCEDEDIIVTGTMPLGSPERPARFRRDDDPEVMDDAELKAIAKEAGCSVAQVIIRWHLQRGTVCIPKATEEWMIMENFNALSFKLSQEHMQRISALDRHYRYARGEVFRWKEHQPWQELFDHE